MAEKNNDKNVMFSNPDCLPVEDVTISINNDGVLRRVKALDPHWVDKRELILYEAPPRGSAMIFGAVEAWKTKMKVYLENLRWLLQLEHHRFWSTILYHPQCMDSLVSYLQEANPPYIPPHDSRDVRNLYSDIRKHILIVFSRLITNKESKTQWMTKEVMAKVIYENFVFTVPIVWDLCLVYGTDNKQHISRLVTSVFALQPQYNNDVSTAIAFVNEAFKYIILQVNKDYDTAEPPNLPETFQGFSEIRRPSNNSKNREKMTFAILRDLIIHLLDTALTLRIFVEVYPKTVEIFKKTKFINSIVQLYEYGIPHLYERLEELGDQTSVQYPEVEGYIDLARVELIDIFREVLAVYKNAILSGDEDNKASNVEDYLTVMMEGLSEKLLIQDYHATYPVHEDIEMLRQACPDIDPVKTDFILQAIYSNLEEPILENYTDQEPEMNGHLESTDNETYEENTDYKIPEDLKEESLISEVKDVLPELGDGFVLKCLQHYGFSSERVINSILEDTLDNSLRGLDRTMPIIPEDPLDQDFLQTGIARLNVFDGDEFDIMHRDDVDVSKIHIGKRRSKYKNLKQMLDDKTEVKKFADMYSKYSLVCDEEALYDDEYDDTYDSDSLAPPADATPDEIRRPFVTPRALQTKPTREDEESEEESDSEEEPQPSSSRNRMDFCANPEEIRARREASYQARRGKSKGLPPRTTDVVGKPKGQGQEKTVIASRDKKEKHKSSRANHNRRGGAQWKRSQGMVPS